MTFSAAVLDKWERTRTVATEVTEDLLARTSRVGVVPRLFYAFGLTAANNTSPTEKPLSSIVFSSVEAGAI
jgi:hypothetical protein